MAHTPSSDDKDKPDSERLARLYRSGAREEPPARFDDIILSEARKSAPARKKSWHSPFGWGAPLSLAAVVVLSVTVVLLLTREGAEPLPPEASKAARSLPEKAPVRPAEPEAQRERAQQPSSVMADRQEQKSPPTASDDATPYAVRPAAPAARSKQAEESRSIAGTASQGLPLSSTPGDEVESACDQALRRLGRFKDARISKKTDARFEYKGKSYTGCVGTVEGERDKLPPDRNVVQEFYPREGSDLSAMGWAVKAQAMGAGHLSYQVMRQDVFCLIEGREGPENVEYSTLIISVKCSKYK